MAISEVNAVVNLVVKATSFIAQLQDGWYKGSVELDTLQNKLSVLRARHGQWNEELQRYGISEDKYLRRLVEESTKALENFQSKVEKLQKSSLRRLKKKVFPGQLLYLVDRIFEIVDAGPQSLAFRVANNDILDKYLAQTPVSLPFGPDSNYVPIADSIWAVRNTLESSEGPRVVTIYGGPGTGKSSLMKYLAILYQEEHRRLRADASFPHGVYYISCGQHAEKKVNQLLLQLLQNLGYGTRPVAVNGSTPSSTGLQEGDNVIALPTNQMRLRSRLAEQTLLIMLDDLWEANVLLELLVPAKGVKYLVTSQMRDICSTAGKIQITEPTLPECSQIMANYTDGFAKKGQFPDNIKSVAVDIVGLLQRHPLSLANIGISINRSRATDIEQWNVIKNHIYLHLDENQCRSPAGYDMRYSLPVSASMMLMVESLPVEEQRLLFVMALLEGPELPESVVKYFYSFIQKDNFVVKYINHERCLEDKSLIELTVRGDESILNVHSLRMHYIRERKSPEVRSVSSQILSPRPSGDQDVASKAIEQGDAEETLATVLSAIYYDKSFKDLVAGTLKNHIRLINDGFTPRSLNIATDRLDLVESARRKRYDIEDLVWLLNADHEVDGWQRQAHESAKKIIIKIVSQGKLEDKSMAYLLRLPQTTSAACRALTALCHFHSEDFYERKLAFSEACSETMQTLLDLFQNDGMSMNKRRIDVITSLLTVLDFESKDYIRTFATEYGKLLEMKSDHNIRHAFEVAMQDYRSFGRGIVAVADSDGILESFIARLVDLGNSELRERDKFILGRTVDALAQLCRFRDLSLKIAAFPEALEMLFHFFISDGLLAPTFHMEAGDALYRLSSVPENRTKVGAIESVWNGLGGTLTKLKDIWCSTPQSKDRRNGERRAQIAAGVLGHLALDKDLRGIIASLPGVQEALLFLQLIETADSYHFISKRPHQGVLLIYFYSTSALITLYSEEAEDPSRAASVPLIGDVLNLVRSCDEGAPSMASSIIADKCYLRLYWSRVLAYTQMGCYAEALKNLDLYLLPQKEICDDFHYCNKFSACRIYLQAMTKDYTGALQGANKRVEENKIVLNLAERGVLKRLSGDLQGGLDDLDAAFVKVHYTSYGHKILWQRGYVKYLMEDTVGAKDDAKAAQGYRDRYRWLEELSWFHVFQLDKIPVTYLGNSV